MVTHIVMWNLKEEAEGAGKEQNAAIMKERLEALDTAFDACDLEGSGCVSIAALMEYTGKAKNTVRAWVDKHPDFERQKDGVRRVKND